MLVLPWRVTLGRQSMMRHFLAKARRSDCSRAMIGVQRLSVFTGSTAQSTPLAPRAGSVGANEGYLGRQGSHDFRERTRLWKQQNATMKDLAVRGEWKEVLGYAESNMDNFNYVNWSTMFTNLGRIRGAKRTIARDDAFRRVLGEFECKVGSNDFQDIGIQALANTVYSLGNMGVRSDVILGGVNGVAAERIAFEGKPQEISMVAYALARLNEREAAFFATMESMGGSKRLAREGKPQEISNTIWAAAKLGCHVPLLAAEIDTKHVAEVLAGEAGKPQAISNALWAMAKLGYKAPNLARELEKKDIAKFMMFEGTSQNIANSIWALAKLGQKAPLLAEMIGRGDVTEYLLREGNSQDIANVLWGMAKLGHDAPLLASGMERRDIARKIARGGTPQAISNVIWALAKCGHRARALAGEIEKEEVAERLVRQGTHQAIRNTMWGLATMGIKAPVLARAIDTKGAPKLFLEGTSQDVATVLWAMAKLEHKAPELASGIEREEVAQKLTREGSSQEIATIMWAMARLGYKAKLLAIKIERKPVVGEFLAMEGKPQEIANVMWAMAVLGHKAPVFARELEKKDAADKIAREGTPQAISNIIWAMAKLGCESTVFAGKVDSEEVVEKLVREGTSQAIGNAMWAMTALGHQMPNLATSVERKEVAQRISSEGNSEEIGNIVWAIAEQKYDCPTLLRSISQGIGGTISGEPSRIVSKIARAFASLGHFDDGAFDQFAKHARRVAEKGSTRDICGMLYALAIAGKVKVHEDAVRILWDEAEGRPTLEFAKEDWNHMEAAMFHARSEGVALRVKDSNKMMRMTEAGSADAAGKAPPSFKDEIAQELFDFGYSGFSELGYEGFERDFVPFKGDGAGKSLGNFLKIDVAWKKKRVALQLNGPSQFLTRIGEEGGLDNEHKTRDGDTLAKARLLNKMGWKLISFSSFDNMARSEMSTDERKKMWVELLGPCGIAPKGKGRQ